jgi:menaquinone-specific isochorismate synthase
MSEVITTELLGEHPALHKIATDEQLSTSWIRGNEGFIGFGEWRSTSVKGPNRFADARKWWQEQLNSLKIVNEVHGIGTGPILFASFSFDQDDESRLVIPKIVIGQRGNKSWITWIGNYPEVKEANESKNPINVNFVTGALSDIQWRDRVAKAIEHIKNGDLEKVVLARDLVAKADHEISIRSLINTLIENYPSTWTFLVSNMVGATPELLVRLSKSLVTSRVLAGTIKKTGDESRDLALAASLAKSFEGFRRTRICSPFCRRCTFTLLFFYQCA